MPVHLIYIFARKTYFYLSMVSGRVKILLEFWKYPGHESVSIWLFDVFIHIVEKKNEMLSMKGKHLDIGIGKCLSCW